MNKGKPTVVSGQDVQFTYDMSSIGKKLKHKKKKTGKFHITASAEIINNEENYPSSRVIKKAPNGDVIIESLPDTEVKADQLVSNSAIPSKLDSHWESLTPEEKREILRISKDEVFGVIRNYQSLHNCNCTVCGRRNVAMEKELERIYHQLYENAKESDSDTDFVLFHLNLIKELQHVNISRQHQSTQQTSVSCERQKYNANTKADESPDSSCFLDDMRNEAVRYCLSNQNSDDLKEEVLQFKHNKQKQHKEQLKIPQSQHNSRLQLHSSLQFSNVSSESGNDVQGVNPQMDFDYDELKDKYLRFAKTFVSSHPKIAQEYVNRMMMYPDMRVLTEDLINNNGQGFIKAMEDFVSSQKRCGNNQALSDEQKQLIPDGESITSEQYQELQRHIAEKMTHNFDPETHEWKNVTPLEGELFSKFLTGENRQQFGDMIFESFKKKFEQRRNCDGLDGIFNTDGAESDGQYEDEGESVYEEDAEDEERSIYGEENNDEYEENNEEDLDSYDEHGSFHHGEYHYSNNIHSEETNGGEDYDTDIDQQERLEEGRRLIQIAITKLLQKKLVASYQEKQAEKNREKLLLELEVEEKLKKEKEEKKQKKKEKEKEKKKVQQLLREEEKRKKGQEEERLKKEAEERELVRREAQRRKVEEVKRKKDEEKRKRLQEQRRREEEQEFQRKLKEEQKRKRDEERKQKEEKQRKKKIEKELRKQQLEEEKRRKQEQELMEENIKQENQQEDFGKDKDLHNMLSVEAVPYGVSNNSISNKALLIQPTINDDIFNMVNEAASKSMASSPSHLNTLLQSQDLSPLNASQTTLNGLASHSPFLPPPGLSNIAFDQVATKSQQQTVVLLPPGLPQLQVANSWDQQNGLFSSTQLGNQTSQHTQTQIFQSSQHSSSFSPFKNNIDIDTRGNEEFNNLASFLSQTTLQDTNMSQSNSIPSIHSISRQDSSTFDIWGTEQPSPTFMPSQTSIPSTVSNVSASRPRKSIWDNSFGAGLWSTKAVPDNSTGSSNSVIPQSQLTDIIFQCYSLLSSSNGYVNLDTFYQALLNFMADESKLHYSQFINQLLSMRQSHNCEVISNDSGTFTHCRMGLPPSTSQSVQSSGIINDVYTNSIISGSIDPSISQTGSKSHLFDFNQTITPSSSISKNIWG